MGNNQIVLLDLINNTLKKLRIVRYYSNKQDNTSAYRIVTKLSAIAIVCLVFTIFSVTELIESCDDLLTILERSFELTCS